MRRMYCWTLGLAVFMSGCGGPANPPVTEKEMEDTKLNDVAELCRVYQTNKSKPPAKFADLAPFEQMSPMGLQALRSGDIIVRFGATLPDTAEGPGKGTSDEVLAFQKQVPTSGGQVLMLDRTVKSMTPEEFKAAKLAGTESSQAEPVSKKKKR